MDVCWLDWFKVQYGDPVHKLREVIRTWLTTSDTPTWRVIVEALKSPVTGEGQLAMDLYNKSTAPVDSNLWMVSDFT